MRHPILVLPALLLALSCGQGEDGESSFRSGGTSTYKTLNEPQSADQTQKPKAPAPKKTESEDEAGGIVDDDAATDHDHDEHEPDAPDATQPPADEPVEAPAPTPPPAAAPMPAPAPAPAPAGPAKDPNVVEFRIKAGTGNGPWNTEAEMVVAKVGQTIRIVNDDTVTHRLHTGGAPCPHGPDFAPGATFECKATRAFDPKGAAGPVYDHIAGRAAAFWLKVEP